MKRARNSVRISSLILALSAHALLTLPQAQEAPRYRIRGLETLASNGGGEAFSVNESGIAVGDTLGQLFPCGPGSVCQTPRPFVQRGDTIYDIGADDPSVPGFTYAINNRNLVVGFQLDHSLNSQAYVWGVGMAIPLPTPGVGSIAFDINDRAQIVGLTHTADGLNLPTLDLTGAFDYTLHYSTEFSLTSNRLGPVSDGDVLSSTGRLVRSNAALTPHLNITPVVPDVGLDALGRTPATNTLLFSAEIDVFSRSLGTIQHGDLLSVHGFIAQTNQQLTAAFQPQTPVPDVGLDAIHADLATGEIWFSLEDPLFSQALGILLQPGDLLSSAGYVVRTNAELLAHFTITNPDLQDYGLDAVTKLPDGTLLFSTDESFFDPRIGAVGHGDVLSESGQVVVGNLELVWPFEPLEDLGDFGLDALQVVPRGPLPGVTRMP